MIRLSILDQSIAAFGKPEDQTVRDTLELARHCDKLGYHHFWLSEHHNHQTIMGTAPVILMAAITQVTDRIRIGSAGIMLPHYSPFKVAEQFRVLHALARGRIDLGIGRAPGSDGIMGPALNPNGMANTAHRPKHLRDLIDWVSGRSLSEQHPFGSLIAHPQAITSPEVWMLGTSDYGARLAAHVGLPYCFAYFITDGRGTQQALDVYRRSYRPSARHPNPQAAICVWALADDTEEDAARRFAPRLHWKPTRDRGGMEPLHPPAVVAGFQYSMAEKAQLERLDNLAIYGDVDRVAEKLSAFAEEFDLDEVVVVTWTYDEADRRRSYKLLASAFELKNNAV